jgi:hypothetical protein
VKALSSAWAVLLCAPVCTGSCHEERASSRPADTAEAAAPAPSPAAASAPLPCRSRDPLEPSKPLPAGPRHTWKSISYPSIATPWGIGGTAIPLVAVDDPRGGLRLILSFLAPYDDKEREKMPMPREGEDLQILLHTPHGKVPPKCDPSRLVAWFGGGGAMSGGTSFSFPWQANDLLEAWIELRLPDLSYWLTIPYGFTRDPRDPLGPPDPSLERPSAPPLGAEPGRRAKVVPWQAVSYDLGPINKEKWRLSFTQSNPFHAATVLTLYKDNNLNGLLSWGIDSPKTAIRVEHGYAMAGILTSITREEDGFRRTDRFHLQDSHHEAGRFWGTLIISVDGKDYPVAMPSSLFKYTHGETDLYALGDAGP